MKKRNLRASLTDFQRHKVKVLRKVRNTAVKKEYEKLQKEDVEKQTKRLEKHFENDAKIMKKKLVKEKVMKLRRARRYNKIMQKKAEERKKAKQQTTTTNA
jgi:hypothetical protein